MSKSSRQSDSSGDKADSPGRKLTRKQLINRLNAVNFRDTNILINLKHIRFGNPLVLNAKPQPCAGDTLQCTWTEPDKLPSHLDDYSCSNFMLNDGKRSYAVTPELLAIDHFSISLSLPAISRQTAERAFRRFDSHHITAQIFQNGCLFSGLLIDFSSVSMRVDIQLTEDQSTRWINPEQGTELILFLDDDVIYSGRCRIIREQSRGGRQMTMVLAPIAPTANRYRNSEYRSSRHHLVPAPTASFHHPLSGRLVNLMTQIVSGTGFAVDEPSSESILFPGLIIPNMQLRFTSHFSITCRAQVVSLERTPQDDDGVTRCGFAFLDMSADDHLQLLSLVHRTGNAQAHLSFNVDTERLIDFFFNAGFFYPEKYASVAPDKAELKRTYDRLYNNCPTIARHFVHQDNTAIYAHMAAVRFYQNAWLIHHHAASGEHSTRGGLDVLKQITRWLNDSRNIPSVHLDYFLCYFRDTNRFPMRVFGGIAKGVDNPSACSLDSFAYYYHQPDRNAQWNLQQPWALQRSSDEDLQELGFYYEAYSGGLLPNALDLLPEAQNDKSLNAEFSRNGFSRARHLFSLKANGRLKAVFVVNLADFGLNLSELTSAIQVFVPDHEELPRELLNLILSLLCLKFKRARMPVLLFPKEAAEAYDIEIEKTYLLWIFNATHMDEFFREMKKITHSIGH